MPGPTPAVDSAWSGLSPSALGLVWVGGTAGTAARHLLGAAVFTTGVATVLFVNLVGAFLLGMLVARLGPAPLRGRRRGLRLLLGTGFLGGFTTYSALAVDTVVLARGSTPGWAAAYALGSVVLGVLAAVAGTQVGRQHR